MSEPSTEDLQQIIEADFDGIADQVVDQYFENSIEHLDGAEDFRAAAEFHVAPQKLAASSALVVHNLAPALQAQLFSSAALATKGIVATPAGAAAAAGVDSAAVVAAADSATRGTAADAIRDLICNKLKDWFEDRIEQIRKWFEEDGLKAVLKKIGSVAKDLAKAAVGAIAAAVGSTWLAYLLLGVAVAAVAAAIYFLIRNGLPKYCAV